MKTCIFDNLPEGSHTNWYCLPDSSLSNAGKPFFIPEHYESINLYIAPVVRIDRLGKHISSKFAGRYYSFAAPALHFRNDTLRRSLLSRGLSPDEAQAFDKALIIGDFLPSENLFSGSTIRMYVNGEGKDEWICDNQTSLTASAIERVSLCNTMKTGDLIVPVLSSGVEVGIGDTVEIRKGDETLLFVKVK